jgi:glycosyltransferase involved in cell wall biosynthesis
MSKKICFVLPKLSGGGAERVLINLANYFSSKKMLIDLVVIDKTGVYANNIIGRVNLINLNKNRALSALFPLIKYLKQNKPDAVLTTMPHISLVVIVARILSGIKTNLVIRQPNYLSLNSGQKWWKNHYIKLVCFLFNRANKVIGISQGVCDDLSNLGVKECQTIYNPAAFPGIFELSKQKVDFNFEKKTFIAAGRLVKQKNFSLLIDAFNRVKQELDCQLIILGDGELRGDLEKQIDRLQLEDVYLLGFVDNPFNFIKQADVFVLSSLWEGFGNVIVESLALGTQVVSTDCLSGPSEILDRGKFGFLVEMNNSKILSHAMMKALNNPIDQETLISRSKFFSIDKVAKQYKQVLLDEG